MIWLCDSGTMETLIPASRPSGSRTRASKLQLPEQRSLSSLPVPSREAETCPETGSTENLAESSSALDAMEKVRRSLKMLASVLFVLPSSWTYRILEIHCIALDGFDLNTVHKLSSTEKSSQREKSWRNHDSNPGLLPLCYEAPFPRLRTWSPLCQPYQRFTNLHTLNYITCNKKSK